MTFEGGVGSPSNYCYVRLWTAHEYPYSHNNLCNKSTSRTFNSEGTELTALDPEDLTEGGVYIPVDTSIEDRSIL